MTLPTTIDPALLALLLKAVTILVLLLIVAMLVTMNHRLHKFQTGVYQASLGIEREIKINAAQMEQLSRGMLESNRQLEVCTSALLGIEATTAEIQKRIPKER